jgi:hypothetical protein
MRRWPFASLADERHSRCTRLEGLLWQACQRARQTSGLEADPFKAKRRILEHPQQILRLATFTSRQTFPSSSMTQIAVSLTETSRPAECSCCDFPPDVCGCPKQTTFHHQLRAQRPSQDFNSECFAPMTMARPTIGAQFSPHDVG